ncbi:hypothetical protein HDU97_007128 [Phlyctochytrium planicorne]|nr:hypothetical protein HDU97_007128 [Phlyctochytrium planicorne]
MICVLGRLSSISKEKLSKILLLAGDWKLAVSIELEAIPANLPRSYSDPAVALQSVNLPSTFRAASILLKGTEGCTTNDIDAIGFIEAIDDNKSGAPLNRQEDEQNWLNVIKFLHAHRKEGCTTAAMDQVARLGYLSVIKFLRTKLKQRCTAAAMRQAGKRGNLPVILYLLKHFSNVYTATETISGAVEGGQLHILQYCHRNKLGDFYPYLMTLAAKNGHLRIIKFLVNNTSAGFNADVYLKAAMGNMDVFDYLMESADLYLDIDSAETLADVSGALAL